MRQYVSTVTRDHMTDNPVTIITGYHYDAPSAWAFMLEARTSHTAGHLSDCKCQDSTEAIRKAIRNMRAGVVYGPNSDHLTDSQAYLRTLAYEVKFVPVEPESGWLIAQAWPHALPRPVRVGKGLKLHGGLGVVTGCGKVWTRDEGDAISHTAKSIDCAACVKVIDQRNTWHCKTSYGANASFENESFGYGVAVDKATEWRLDWYEREAISRAARASLGLVR
jgi:hypothetical protein